MFMLFEVVNAMSVCFTPVRSQQGMVSTVAGPARDEAAARYLRAHPETDRRVRGLRYVRRLDCEECSRMFYEV